MLVGAVGQAVMKHSHAPGPRFDFDLELGERGLAALFHVWRTVRERRFREESWIQNEKKRREFCQNGRDSAWEIEFSSNRELFTNQSMPTTPPLRRKNKLNKFKTKYH